jgi:hypothetical protein
MAQQTLAVVAITRIEPDPDAGGDGDLAPPELARAGAERHEPLRRRHRDARVAQVLEDQAELVAAEAGEGITGA